MNCCNNLNRNVASELLRDDVVTTSTVGTSSVTLLSPSASRRMIKIYCLSLTVPSAELWIRYGTGATLLNSAHPLLLRNLLVVDWGQAANAISAVCSAGTAQLRVSSVEKV